MTREMAPMSYAILYWLCLITVLLAAHVWRHWDDGRKASPDD